MMEKVLAAGSRQVAAGAAAIRVTRSTWTFSPSQTGTLLTEAGSLPNGVMTMDENRVEGAARNFGGKAQEGVGSVTGSARTQAEGLANQATGAAQDLYGQAADTVREKASSFEKALRHTIETPAIYQRLSGTRDRMAPGSHASAIVSRHVNSAKRANRT